MRSASYPFRTGARGHAGGALAAHPERSSRAARAHERVRVDAFVKEDYLRKPFRSEASVRGHRPISVLRGLHVRRAYTLSVRTSTFKIVLQTLKNFKRAPNPY